MRSNWMLAGLAALTLGGASTVALGQSDDAVSPASRRFEQAGQAALGKGQILAAVGEFETALAIDPKNRNAFIGMARAMQAQGLYGSAIKFYREALQLDPNDLAALEGQGEALAQRGAKQLAQANLERIRKLCGGDCAQARKLGAAIAQAPAGPQTTAAAAPPPTVQKN
jgi:Tfp pilus assembly protein PilF